MPSPTRAVRTLLAVLLLGALAEAALRAAGWLDRRRAATLELQERDSRPGDVNVMCLGESSTAGAGVAPAESYPKQLEGLLRDFYDNPSIHAIVPLDAGQNTSQMADRIATHLDRYKPRLVVLMAGHHNDTALDGSHVARFLERGGAEALRMRALATLERLRLFQFARHAYLRLLAHRSAAAGAGSADAEPPGDLLEGGVSAFAERHREAFARMWRADLEALVQAARAGGARALLMTYPIPERQLPAREAAELAARLDVPLVRNDLAFEALGRQGRLERQLSEDAWHPAPAGYALIASNAFQAIWQNDLLGLLPARPVPEGLAWGSGRLALGTRAADPYLGTGWSAPEAGPAGRYRWTDGTSAEVRLDLSGPERRILRLRLDPFLARDALARQRVHVLVNGRPSARLWLAAPETRVHSVAVPEQECRGRASLTLLLPDARSPASLELSDDTRRLGVAVEWLSLEDFPEAVPGSRLELGTAAADAHLGAGWTAAEDGARWMQAPRAELLFRWKREGPLTLRMRVRALRPRALASPAMTVDLNGQRLDPFRVRPTDALPSVYELKLPTSALEERNVLAFEWPGALADFHEPPGLRVESVELAP